MDKLSKKVLEYMNHHTEDPSSSIYDFGEDLNNMAKDLAVGTEDLRGTIRYLEELQFITFHDSNGRVIWFSLDHRGLHWKEFRWEERLNYLKDNWIDFFAMLAAIASLILSLIALSR